MGRGGGGWGNRKTIQTSLKSYNIIWCHIPNLSNFQASLAHYIANAPSKDSSFGLWYIFFVLHSPSEEEITELFKKIKIAILW